MPRLTTDFNGILTGEQLGHIHGENEPYRYSFGSHKGHYINVVKRGLREVPHSDISSTSLIATDNTLREIGSPASFRGWWRP